MVKFEVIEITKEEMNQLDQDDWVYLGMNEGKYSLKKRVRK